MFIWNYIQMDYENEACSFGVVCEEMGERNWSILSSCEGWEDLWG